MVDFLTLLQQTFRKFALKAEIALVLDREIANRQRKFGVELYDLIEKQRTTVKQQIKDELQKKEDENVKKDDKEKREATTAKEKADTVEKNVQQLLQVFQTIENEIRLPLEATQKEVDDMKLSQPPFPPIFMQRRKEAFGLTIWPMISDSTLSVPESLEKEFQKTEKDSSTGTPAALDFMNKAIKGLVKGTKATLKKAVGSLSPAEREVEACVELAKQDMQLLEAKKLVKTKELEQLVESGTTVECF